MVILSTVMTGFAFAFGDIKVLIGLRNHRGHLSLVTSDAFDVSHGDGHGHLGIIGVLLLEQGFDLLQARKEFFLASRIKDDEFVAPITVAGFEAETLLDRFG